MVRKIQMFFRRFSFIWKSLPLISAVILLLTAILYLEGFIGKNKVGRNLIEIVKSSVVLSAVGNISILTTLMVFIFQERSARSRENWRDVHSVPPGGISYLRNRALMDLACSGEDMSGLNAEAVDLSGVNLREAKLRGSNFQKAILWKANLQNADLRDAIFVEAELEFANFQDANLSAANFQNAKLDGINLSRARLCLVDLSQASLKSADLKKADLENAKFVNTNLSQTDFEKANLRDAIFDGAKFGNTHLSYANLRGAKGLTESQLAGAKLCYTVLPDGTTNCRDCKELGVL
jgi:uncharacterized protein YjbI with pentapeptide repeats